MLRKCCRRLRYLKDHMKMKTSVLNFQICNELCLNRREVLINWRVRGKQTRNPFLFVLLFVARWCKTTRIYNSLAWYIVAKVFLINSRFLSVLQVVWWTNGALMANYRRVKRVSPKKTALRSFRTTFFQLFCQRDNIINPQNEKAN